MRTKRDRKVDIVISLLWWNCDTVGAGVNKQGLRGNHNWIARSLLEITSEYEAKVLPNFEASPINMTAGGDFYTDPHFDEKKFFAPRTKLSDTPIMKTGGSPA